MKKALGSLAMAAALSGCATGQGNAPAFERGGNRSSAPQSPQTEMVAPGVGSALFPDPSWR